MDICEIRSEPQGLAIVDDGGSVAALAGEGADAGLRSGHAMKRIDLSNYTEALVRSRQPWQAKYFAMYSSLLDGLVTDPVLMQLPVDDHLVHRGDGVFETCKCVAGGIYLLDAHMVRLERSAAAIGIRWPGGMETIRRLTIETARAAAQRDCSIRVILARGPGSFGVNPYESSAPALYIVVYGLGRAFMDVHPAGATMRRSAIPAKPSEMAEIKNCNYLPNVLMKRESVDWGVDFVVSFDSDGHMGEGATENFGVVTRSRELLFPRVGTVLAGTTMRRALQLAETLVASGELSRVGFRDIAESDVRDAAEMLVVGTSVDVASVITFEGAPVGGGEPGPVGRALNALLERDMTTNGVLRARY